MTRGPSASIIAVSMDERRLHGALIGSSSMLPLESPVENEGPPTLTAAVDLAAALLIQAERRGAPVCGLAVAAAPGDFADDVLDGLRTRFGVPTTRHPLLPAAMLGEQIHGGAQSVDSAVLFDAGRLAAGLMLNGRLVYGAHGRAGGLSHTSVDATGGIRCTCGKVGCLAAVLAAAPEAPWPNLPSRLPPMPSRELGWLALATIHLINTINPAALILGGAAIRAEADFIWLAAAAEHGCLAPARGGLRRICRARSDNALIGAAAGFRAAAGPDPAFPQDSNRESNLVQDAILHS